MMQEIKITTTENIVSRRARATDCSGTFKSELIHGTIEGLSFRTLRSSHLTVPANSLKIVVTDQRIEHGIGNE